MLKSRIGIQRDQSRIVILSLYTLPFSFHVFCVTVVVVGLAFYETNLDDF